MMQSSECKAEEKSNLLTCTNSGIKSSIEKIQEIFLKMNLLMLSFCQLKHRIEESKKIDFEGKYIDYFIPLVQEISKKSHLEYLKFIKIMTELDDELISDHQIFNEEIILLLKTQSKKNGQEILGIFNHPDEIDQDKMIEKIKKSMENIIPEKKSENGLKSNL